MTRPELLELVRATVAEFSDRDAAVDESTRLFGPDGILDSMGLVSALAEIELRVREQFGGSVILADERALSQSRSPFRSVGALTDYALEVYEQR